VLAWVTVIVNDLRAQGVISDAQVPVKSQTLAK
jgi:hypothetical protein